LADSRQGRTFLIAHAYPFDAILRRIAFENGFSASPTIPNT